MPEFVTDGLGLIFITNMAIIVEGVIADIIDDYCVNNNTTPNWGVNLEKATWFNKNSKYNSLFAKKLESYRGYDAIDILFQFRNNVAHGLAHIEESSIQELTNNTSPLKSTNNNYQKIRKFLIKRQIVKATDISSNANHLRKFNTAIYFWLETRCFLEDILRHNESPFNEGIKSEWSTAISGRG
jgi:hypothetical protein